jgi:hypothetical protein
MAFSNTISTAIAAVKKAGGTSKQKLLIDLENLIIPELVSVQDIGCQEFCCNSTGEIL